MRKVGSLEEISDGKVYGLNDMVRADCQSCKGCSDCCKGMGKSIILDPYDVYRITKAEGVSFEQLLQKTVELSVVDGVILPNLKMTEDTDQCAYLNEEGRCSIHSYRPGLCRLFPLGRCYNEDSFQYFLQNNECSKKNRTKVKVSKWIDTPDLKKNQKFILEWHNFLKNVEEYLNSEEKDEIHKKINMYILNYFYIMPYDYELDFYQQFEARMKAFSMG